MIYENNCNVNKICVNVMLKDGTLLTTKDKPCGIETIANAIEQLDNNSDIIRFGWLGVKRELINWFVFYEM